jgi:hypothetical protein
LPGACQETPLPAGRIIAFCGAINTGARPMIGAHPVGPQPAPERDGPRSNEQMIAGGATRASSASLRMAGIPPWRESARESGSWPRANGDGFASSEGLSAHATCGFAGPGKASSVQTGRTITKGLRREKAKITIQARCTNYNEIGTNYKLATDKRR